MRHLATACWFALCFAATVRTQAPADGLRLFGGVGLTDTWLVDSNSVIVHTWPSPYRPGLSVHLESDGTLLRSIDVTTFPVGGAGGGLQRVALDGTVTWDFRYDSGGNMSHHDLEPLPNGNVLILAWEQKTNAEAVAAGRNPLMMLPGSFRPDHIVEVQQTGPTTGAIVWEWHAWDHLIQDFDPLQANYGVVADHPELLDINFPPNVPFEGDWTHCNSIDYCPDNDWILISSRHTSEIWIIDHGTTTQEAAGHTGGARGKGGDILYRWGNPRAYRAGTGADQQTFGQHDARFILPGRPGAGNVTLFDNRWGTAGNSRVIEIELPLDAAGNFVLAPTGRYGPIAPLWEHSGTFNSSIMSGTERLPNGNQLICSAIQGSVHEVTPAGTTLWQYSLPGTIFHARFVDRGLWQDTDELSVSQGGTITFDLMTGSPHSGSTYLVVGSSTGTTPGLPVAGMTLPLAFDGYMLTTVRSPNALPFGNTLGVLDQSGTAQATFALPAAVLPPQAVGLELFHAFVSFDQFTSVPEYVSAAVRFELVP